MREKYIVGINEEYTRNPDEVAKYFTTRYDVKIGNVKLEWFVLAHFIRDGVPVEYTGKYANS